MHWLNGYIGTNSIEQKDGPEDLERRHGGDSGLASRDEWMVVRGRADIASEEGACAVPQCARPEEWEMLVFPRAQPWPCAGGEEWAGDAHPRRTCGSCSKQPDFAPNTGTKDSLK